MASLSINSSDIIGVKHYPENYTNDLISVLDALSYKPNKNISVESPIIYGSASIKMSSPSDYDCYQKIKTKNIVSIVKEFKEIIKRLEAYKGVYIADIKAGSIDSLKIVPNDIEEDDWDKQLPAMQDKVRELYRLHKLDKKEVDLCFKYLKPNLRNFDIAIVRKEIRFNIGRWTPEEIKRGYIIRRGYKLTLEEAVQQKELTKVDVISFSVNRYTEISMVYLYEMGGHVLNTGYNEEDRELLLQQTIPPLIYEDNYFKVSKRVFAIERYRTRPNLRVLELLMRLFNSDIGRLYQIVSDCNTALYMFDNYNYIDMDKIKYMFNQFRFRTSNFINKKYEKRETEYLKLLGEFENDPKKKRNKLELYRDEMFELMNSQTKEYLETNRLLPIPAEYLPYRTEPEKIEKRNTIPSKLLGSGEMSKYKNQYLLEDNENDIVGSGGIPKNKKLYESIKKRLFSKYPKHSAYRSMMLVKEYKKAGGIYSNSKSNKMNTKKWLGQKWTSVNDYYHNNEIVNCGSSDTEHKYNEYPLCRPQSIVKKLSKPQMKKLIDEKNILKKKPLKSSKILNSEEYNIKDTTTGSGIKKNIIKMNLKDLITEHEKLIGVLKKGTPKERIAEALKQYHELKGYLGVV